MHVSKEDLSTEKSLQKNRNTRRRNRSKRLLLLRMALHKHGCVLGYNRPKTAPYSAPQNYQDELGQPLNLVIVHKDEVRHRLRLQTTRKFARPVHLL